MPILPNPCLMVLTDRTRLTPNWTLAQAIAPAITGGCNLIVLRESDIPSNHRATITGFVKDGIKGRTPLIIADDATLAKRYETQGVHLSQVAMLAGIAENSDAILGVSVRNREEAEVASNRGADYLLIEYDWTHPDKVLDHFQHLRQDISTPFILGSDMSPDMAGRCVAAGAIGIAICSPAMSAYDKTAACRAYATAIGTL